MNAPNLSDYFRQEEQEERQEVGRFLLRVLEGEGADERQEARGELLERITRARLDREPDDAA